MAEYKCWMDEDCDEYEWVEGDDSFTAAAKYAKYYATKTGTLWVESGGVKSDSVKFEIWTEPSFYARAAKRVYAKA